MITYIMCPYYKTGGPNNMHQLCDTLNSLGYEAYIYYLPNKPYEKPLYSYPHLKITNSIQDTSTNLLIAPEIYSTKELKSVFAHINIVTWWLSYTNAALFNQLADNARNHPAPIHLFHSYFEYVNITPLLPPSTKRYFISDYVEVPETPLHPKQDCIAYNFSKDFITPHYCNQLSIQTRPIKDMTHEEVLATFSQSKIYVDLGFHPGKDRMPREAALCNCVIVTNKAGAAAYEQDVPIEEKINFEEELLTLLPHILQHYDYYLEKQKIYRNRIKSERSLFTKQVSQTWKEFHGSLYP